MRFFGRWAWAPAWRGQALALDQVFEVGQDVPGHAETELVGRRAADFSHPDDRGHLMQEWRKSLTSEGRHPYDVEVRIRRHDGRHPGLPVRGRRPPARVAHRGAV